MNFSPFTRPKNPEALPRISPLEAGMIMQVVFNTDEAVKDANNAVSQHPHMPYLTTIAKPAIKNTPAATNTVPPNQTLNSVVDELLLGERSDGAPAAVSEPSDLARVAPQRTENSSNSNVVSLDSARSAVHAAYVLHKAA
jgi:hypothetical protein